MVVSDYILLGLFSNFHNVAQLLCIMNSCDRMTDHSGFEPTLFPSYFKGRPRPRRRPTGTSTAPRRNTESGCVSRMKPGMEIAGRTIITCN